MVEWRRLQWAVLRGLADVAPEHLKRALGLLAAAAAYAVGEHRGIHGAGRGAGDRLDLEPVLVEQAIQHAPGIGTVRAAALQGEVDALDLHGPFSLVSARSSRRPWEAPRRSPRRRCRCTGTGRVLQARRPRQSACWVGSSAARR